MTAGRVALTGTIDRENRSTYIISVKVHRYISYYVRVDSVVTMGQNIIIIGIEIVTCVGFKVTG